MRDGWKVDPASVWLGGAQCGIFTGIGPDAESNPATLRIKYGMIPKKAGISPDPAAESNVGYIPPFWHATVARPCVFVRAEPMPKAAKAGLARSHGDELVQRTLDGSAQRPSPKAHRARPSATVPAQANRRKKRKATGSAGEPPAAAARSPTAAAQGHSDRQPSATAAQDGGPGQLLIGNYHVGGPISWRHRSRLPRRWSSI